MIKKDHVPSWQNTFIVGGKYLGSQPNSFSYGKILRKLYKIRKAKVGHSFDSNWSKNGDHSQRLAPKDPEEEIR